MVTQLGERIITNCTYEVLMNSTDGQPVKFAKVGDRLVHKWSCDSEDYGMIVHSCFVHEYRGTSFQLVDNRGCITDPTLMNQLIYSDNLTVAYSVVPAFKFANQLTLSFQCKVTLCNKGRNGCVGISPPDCKIVPTSTSKPSIPSLTPIPLTTILTSVPHTTELTSTTPILTSTVPTSTPIPTTLSIVTSTLPPSTLTTRVIFELICNRVKHVIHAGLEEQDEHITSSKTLFASSMSRDIEHLPCDDVKADHS
ncbi:unnamed protein product [Cercopithifilaria johnstoni]|uniref:ZP domain-containing protein n=1 Tax=Cercopithifilaria johnstoni TaxID=2874296 RepID=A0A8J2Q8E7_9BILA|nr:unnamed protein product [Cercopithifilaria johnstoni]